MGSAGTELMVLDNNTSIATIPKVTYDIAPVFKTMQQAVEVWKSDILDEFYSSKMPRFQSNSDLIVDGEYKDVTSEEKVESKKNVTTNNKAVQSPFNWSDLTEQASKGIQNVIRLSDTMTQLRSKVDFMNDGLDETDNIQQKILNSAQQARMPYQDAANTVADLGIQAKNAFSSSDEVVGFAELVSKQFQIAGGSSKDATGALSQLSQAMSDGVMSGTELNSIFEQTPNIMQNIADYMGVPIDKVNELADNGQITADTLKNALFTASGEINENFNRVPMTWNDIGEKIKNQALNVFQPVLEKVNELANNENIQNFSSNFMSIFSGIADFGVLMINKISEGIQFMADNWSWLAPIVTSLGMVVGIIMAIVAATQLWSSAMAIVSLVASPILLIIGAIILAIYLVVGVINQLTGATISATGIILGTFAVMGAEIMNRFVIPSYNNFAMLANFLGNVFTNPVASIKILFLDMVISVIGYIANLATAIESVVNSIPGMDDINITGGLVSFQNSISAQRDKIKKDSGYKTFVETKEYVDYIDAANGGYNLGKDIDTKVSGFFDKNNTSSITDSLSGVNPNTGADTSTATIKNSLGNIDTNTASGAASAGRVADSVEIADEDMKYLRDIAEREIIDRTIFKSLNVSMGGVSNTVNNMSDLDGIADYLGDVISQTAVSSMEGA